MNMGMGMYMRLEPRMNLEQRIDQRLSLIQTLKQMLQMQVEMKISLELYLEREDLAKKLVRWAHEHDSFVKFSREGFEFEYALVPYKLAKPIASKYGPGFSHCMYDAFEEMFLGKTIALARGDWTLFVVKEMAPKELRDFIAVHERGEELSLGNHYFASQLEFALVNKDHKIRKYTSFINKKHPTKFVDLTQEVLYPVLPEELVEYLSNQGKRNEQELEKAEQLIEKYQIPTTVLRFMDKYNDATQTVCETIRKEIGITQNKLYELFKRGTSPEEIADTINKELSDALISVKPEQARGISRLRANEELRLFSELIRKGLFEKMKRHIYIPTDFETAYKDAVKGKRLVTVGYTVEDRVRQERDEKIKGYKLTAN